MSTLYYVGLDVHKETIEVVAFRDNEMVPCIEKRIPSCTRVLLIYLGDDGGITSIGGKDEK